MMKTAKIIFDRLEIVLYFALAKAKKTDHALSLINE